MAQCSYFHAYEGIYTNKDPPQKRGALIVGQLNVSRRLLLPTMGWVSVIARPLPACAEELDEEAARASFFGGASIVPALTIPQYRDRIAEAWPNALRDFQSYMEAGQYKELSESLFLSPFDEVRQAAFFIPYVLAQKDIRAATRSRYAYDAFLDNVKQVYATSLAVAYYQEEEEGVEAAIRSLSSSLQSFLAAIE